MPSLTARLIRLFNPEPLPRRDPLPVERPLPTWKEWEKFQMDMAENLNTQVRRFDKQLDDLENFRTRTIQQLTELQQAFELGDIQTTKVERAAVTAMLTRISGIPATVGQSADYVDGFNKAILMAHEELSSI